MMLRCFVGLGANIGNPLEQLREASEGLRRHGELKNVAVSAVYRSRPMGPQDQPDYLNAAARFDTALTAPSLLRELQSLERRAGRVRSQRWGPRTLDIDLLLYGDECINSDQLIVPHPGLEHRVFVLVPLLELAGAEFRLPGGKRLSHALAHCPDSPMEKVAGPSQLLAPQPGYCQP
ncbi:2-amino-4-hydroxy-6-hydroxymethyldihydropteridine diphosphokinase [Chromatocurvus halotolerans]|uniref:2-amino-4-hydroxy-6-hydroxymethyldihydropteridine pyrophosphokinase n=1 Tax=Chromatocurvus halotolerans TaxID=1132028 RepID=A0A4R2KQV1_9GAMM|nr:2-amino-4-hydroxy-6-hydroxymethyldihydropteridine diphosphokinase [Chromatocurvus halotolerans]TCO75077.1 2-amino-4-hydroxy-6-hydroxymethyldihydropteridine diphosphokinase [Chromatocurvus halotolerans]